MLSLCEITYLQLNNKRSGYLSEFRKATFTYILTSVHYKDKKHIHVDTDGTKYA